MKKFLIGLLLCAFLGSTGCAIYYGVQYNNIDQNQVTDNSGLVQTVAELQETIKTLTADREKLAVDLLSVTTQNEANKALVLSLSANVLALQTTIKDLQEVNNADIATINTLNAQIVNLNNTITELNASIAQNSNKEAVLNGKIAKLENSITYYQQLLRAYEDETKVIATFNYDGAIYNVQVLAVGGKVNVQTPENTEYKQFNGWKVEGTIVDLSNYTLTQDTTFEADITYFYDVNFVVDDSIVATQIVQEGQCPTMPTEPTKEGYVFNGWTLDGNTVIDPTITTISANTSFIANWATQYNVQFKNADGEVISSQKVVRNTFAENVEYIHEYGFLGWSIDGVNVVNISTTPITADTIFLPVFQKQKVVLDNVITSDNITLTTTKSGITPMIQYQDICTVTLTNEYIKSNYVNGQINGAIKVRKITKISSGENPNIEETKVFTYNFVIDMETKTAEIVDGDTFKIAVGVEIVDGMITITFATPVRVGMFFVQNYFVKSLPKIPTTGTAPIVLEEVSLNNSYLVCDR